MEKEISPKQFSLFHCLVFAIILKIMKHLTNIRKVDIYLTNPKCEAMWKVEWLAREKD
jgi:hypothetical protein